MKNKENLIHSTSIIEQGATIGFGTRIWHWTHIMKNANIGKNCILGQNVFVGSRAVIGDNVKIQNNVSIYDKVIIEKNVFCGPSAVFTNIKNPRSLVDRKDQFMKTLVKEGATIGANATIICGVTIGRYSLIGAGSLVSKDIKPFSLVVGNPSKQIGWVSRYGIKLRLPLFGEGEQICKFSQKKYILKKYNLFERRV